MAHDRAPGEPVPDQEPAYRKSRALIALQLIKRWRNVLFAKRERAKLRRPPSVLLSKHVADHANRTTTLSEEVEHQARQLLLRLEAEKAAGRLIHEVNPRCREDVLTDRWPEIPHEPEPHDRRPARLHRRHCSCSAVAVVDRQDRR